MTADDLARLLREAAKADYKWLPVRLAQLLDDAEHLAAAPVVPPPPSAREWLWTRIRDQHDCVTPECCSCRYTTDAILADLGLDENGKRAMPDDAAIRQLSVDYARNVGFSDGLRNVEAIRALLVATGHYAERKP